MVHGFYWKWQQQKTWWAMQICFRYRKAYLIWVKERSSFWRWFINMTLIVWLFFTTRLNWHVNSGLLKWGKQNRTVELNLLDSIFMQSVKNDWIAFSCHFFFVVAYCKTFFIRKSCEPVLNKKKQQNFN